VTHQEGSFISTLFLQVKYTLLITEINNITDRRSY